MIDDVESVVFSGGGMRGIAFCGSLMALRSWNAGSAMDCAAPDKPPPLFPRLRRTSGASVGALFACTTALRISSEKLFRLIDDEALLDGLVPSVDLSLLQKDLGLDDGRRLRDSVLRVLEIGIEQWGRSADDAGTLTLAELRNLTAVDVKISTTRLGGLKHDPTDRPKCEILSADATPDLRVVDALVMSMCVPILYKPVQYKGGIYVDGGILNNSPVTGDMVPKTTLVICLAPRSLDLEEGLQNYLSMCLYSGMYFLQEQSINGFHQIVVSSASIKTFDFGARREMLVAAVLDGMVGTLSALRQLGIKRQRKEGDAEAAEHSEFIGAQQQLQEAVAPV